MAADVLQFPAHSQDQIPDGHIAGHDLARRSGITYRQLDYWTRTGLLRTSTCATPGYGFIRAYPTGELVVAILIRRLLEGGLNLRPAHDHARRLANTGTTVLAGITIHLPQDL